MVKITGYQPRILDTVIYLLTHITTLASHTLCTVTMWAIQHSAKVGAHFSPVSRVGGPRPLLDIISLCVVGSTRRPLYVRTHNLLICILEIITLHGFITVAIGETLHQCCNNNNRSVWSHAAPSIMFPLSFNSHSHNKEQ